MNFIFTTRDRLDDKSAKESMDKGASQTYTEKNRHTHRTHKLHTSHTARAHTAWRLKDETFHRPEIVLTRLVYLVPTTTITTFQNNTDPPWFSTLQSISPLPSRTGPAHHPWRCALGHKLLAHIRLRLPLRCLHRLRLPLPLSGSFSRLHTALHAHTLKQRSYTQTCTHTSTHAKVHAPPPLPQAGCGRSTFSSRSSSCSRTTPTLCGGCGCSPRSVG